jgi:hypothetical protein
MKLTRLSLVLPTVVGVALTLGSAAQASPEGVSQERVAATTLNLEKAFSDQFVQGNIDRSALTGAIDDVLQAMPEASRAGAQEHIDRILAAGQKLAAQMTPEQRAAVASAPSPEQVGHAKQGLVAGYGWPGAAGWGGLGAFGWPAFGTGFATGFSTGYYCDSFIGCVGY